jgi:arylsulfatase A-like enzyme
VNQKGKLILLLIITVICIAFTGKNALSAPPKRILLIIMDGARHDYCTPQTMPNLFSFMKGAMVFKNAYSPSSWTLPSHASLFTGLYPQQHGAIKLPYSLTDNVAFDTKGCPAPRKLDDQIC